MFLFSPNWPNPYDHNLECSWVIRSPDSIVELNLLFMDIEASASCRYDSLVIRDGERDGALFLDNYYVGNIGKNKMTSHVKFSNCVFSGETNLSPLLASLCGRELPGPIHSTGDAMFIRFTTDSSVMGQGFNASYSRGDGLVYITFKVLR